LKITYSPHSRLCFSHQHVSHTSLDQAHIHREDINIKGFNNSIENSKIPKVQLDQIYKQSKFKFLKKSDYLITIEERDIPLSRSFETIKLLNQNSLNKHTQKYNYIHIRLVQVGIELLTKEGLNTSILLV